jgi:hypothetical protein
MVSTYRFLQFCESADMNCSLLSNWHTAVILSSNSEYNLAGTLKLGFLTNEIAF